MQTTRDTCTTETRVMLSTRVSISLVVIGKLFLRLVSVEHCLGVQRRPRWPRSIVTRRTHCFLQWTVLARCDSRDVLPEVAVPASDFNKRLQVMVLVLCLVVSDSREKRKEREEEKILVY